MAGGSYRERAPRPAGAGFVHFALRSLRFVTFVNVYSIASSSWPAALPAWPMEAPVEAPSSAEPQQPPPPRRFVGRRAADAALSGAAGAADAGTLAARAAAPRRVVHQQVRAACGARESSADAAPRAQVPREILEDERLNAAIAVLPGNYNFEARRCVRVLCRLL